MRISTNGIAQRSLDALLQQQAAASRTQTELASGKKLQTPSDDPVAAVRLLDLKRALDASDQYSRNADQARIRLNAEEQALADTNTLFRQVRERVIQANSGALSAGDLRAIATDLRGRFSDLVSIANRSDGNGDFLFGGFSNKTQPFSVSGTTVSYQGDQGTRQLQIGPSQRVADGDSGVDVFLSVPRDNAIAVTSAAATNAGTGVLGTSSAISTVVPGNYTVEFSDATNYQVLDGAANVISTGTYTDPGSIDVGGFSVPLTGVPATDDEFTVAISQSEDVFTTLDRAITAIETAATGPQTPQSREQFGTSVSDTLQQLDRIEDRMLTLRTNIGTRLQTLDTTESVRANDKFETQSIVSGIEDLDYTEAITRLTQQLTGLQAAQQSYARLSQLSLFNFLS